jgi:hypothetical protein
MKKLLLSVVMLLVSTIAIFGQKRIAQAETAGEKLNKQYCSGLFSTTDGTYFDMLNDKDAQSAVSYLNILDWLDGRVAGLRIYTLKNHDRLPLIRNSVAGIYVDEILRDPDYLNSLPVTDIAMIKIIKGPFLGGFNSPGGAIAIYTIGTDDDAEE